MANIKAAQSGNWSATSTWTGGVVPVSGDNVSANTYTVTVDVNATVANITNSTLYGATTGGSFALSNGITLTSNIVGFSSNVGNWVTIAGTASATIVGDISAITNNNLNTILMSSSGTLTVTGSVTGGGTAGQTAATAINNTGAGTVNITTLGSVTGGTGGVAVLNSNASGIISITGNVAGGAGAAGVNNASSGIFTITGSVTAGSAAVGANNASTGTFTIIGGNITATNGFSAFVSANTAATIRLSGSFISSVNGTVAVYTPKYILNSTPLNAKTRYALNGTSTYVDMFTSDNNPNGGVATTDVRLGVSYGGGLVGTCAVPNAGTVAFGVAVDNTTGTATLTASNVRAALGLASANLDTQLAVLSNLDTTVSSRLAPSGTLATVTTLTNAPTVPTASAIASQVRAELGTELGRIDADISSRLASSAYSAAPTTAQIATAVEGSLLNEADGQAVLNAIVGAIGNTNLSEVSLVAAVRADLERVGGKIDSIPTTAAPTATANATAVWSAATKEITGGTVDTLTNSPSVPSAASIASATRTELTTELGRLDAAVSTRLATSGYTAPSTAPTAAANAIAVRTELTTELAKVSALNTDRLANVATTAIVGNLIAQANS